MSLYKCLEKILDGCQPIRVITDFWRREWKGRKRGFHLERERCNSLGRTHHFFGTPTKAHKLNIIMRKLWDKNKWRDILQNSWPFRHFKNVSVIKTMTDYYPALKENKREMIHNKFNVWSGTFLCHKGYYWDNWQNPNKARFDDTAV